MGGLVGRTDRVARCRPVQHVDEAGSRVRWPGLPRHHVHHPLHPHWIGAHVGRADDVLVARDAHPLVRTRPQYGHLTVGAHLGDGGVPGDDVGTRKKRSPDLCLHDLIGHGDLAVHLVHCTRLGTEADVGSGARAARPRRQTPSCQACSSDRFHELSAWRSTHRGRFCVRPRRTSLPPGVTHRRPQTEGNPCSRGMSLRRRSLDQRKRAARRSRNV